MHLGYHGFVREPKYSESCLTQNLMTINIVIVCFVLLLQNVQPRQSAGTSNEGFSK